MTPFRRPELFNKDSLAKPCKGVLLFGPPGTGKTMLAKAIAKEAGASFINVSMSSIASEWYVRALFTVAARLSPTIIFIDEIDCLRHQVKQSTLNEFLVHWDGLFTKGANQVLVLAATNRPFDLNEAIIQRFERRIMIGLPDAKNRENILQTILSKEQISDDLDFTELANVTEGYSYSDLKNLCKAACYHRIHELVKKEKEQQENKDALETSKSDNKAKLSVSLGPLNMEHSRAGLREHVSSSSSFEGFELAVFQQWNELYGEGRYGKKQKLSYYM